MRKISKKGRKEKGKRRKVLDRNFDGDSIFKFTLYTIFAPMNTIHLTKTNSDDPDFRNLVRELDANLRSRNGELMDIYDQHNVIEKIDTVTIAWLNGLAVGCGCFKPFDNTTVEIKRMFVKPEARGNKISARILQELEDWAQGLGFEYTVLETGRSIGIIPKSRLCPN
ncbi:MAG: family N-acetyltransferase [Mucilaginibacter sp.]|nr:family N-acetyltransferase [Mucilaginibacter sp.]